jgi:1,4-alpha-glucan branching enzyme
MANTIEFDFFAPTIERAALIGSFNNWQETEMEKGEDGYFRTQIPLEDGVYQYKFRVQTKSPNFEPNQWIEVVDPYATDVDDEKKQAIARIKNGEKVVDTYVWQHDAVPLPQNHELIIYEMHVADFSGGEVDPHKRGKYIDAVEKLDYLKDLGINAIELMPINEYPGDYSWGYKVRHFFASESSYGSTEELKRFIDECHARGIRVIIDGIYNHTDEECPLLLIDRNYWYYQNKHYPEDPMNYWGPEFKYDNYDEKLDVKPAWKYVGDVVRYWIQEYHVDGIRFDAVRQLGNYDFLEWLAHQSKKNTASKPFYNIAEHIPDSSRITSPEGPLDACWHESFHYFIIPHICGDRFDLKSLKQVLDPRQQGYDSAVNVINYLATHDRERIFRELGNRGIFDEAAFERAKFAAAILMTAMGVPMIWMGEEFGEHKRKSENVEQPKKIAWALLEREENRNLLEYYRRLIELRKQHTAVQSDNIEFFYENAEAKILAYIRWNDGGDRVVIIANFSDKALPGYEITHFPADGQWQDWFNNAPIEAKEGKVMTDLQPYTAKLLIYNG